MDEFSLTMRYARKVIKGTSLQAQQQLFLAGLFFVVMVIDSGSRGKLCCKQGFGGTPISPRVALDCPIGSGWLNMPKQSASDQVCTSKIVLCLS
eukprot:scaffold89357_cov17-Tisochrysis_lutea.AAC.1